VVIGIKEVFILLLVDGRGVKFVSGVILGPVTPPLPLIVEQLSGHALSY
jgi:hypothetical protein